MLCAAAQAGALVRAREEREIERGGEREGRGVWEGGGGERASERIVAAVQAPACSAKSRQAPVGCATLTRVVQCRVPGRMSSDPGAAHVDACISTSSSGNAGRRSAGSSARAAEAHPMITDRSAAAASQNVISKTDVVRQGRVPPMHAVQDGSAHRALEGGVKQVSGSSNAEGLAPDPSSAKPKGAGAVRRQDGAAAFEEYRIHVMQTFNSPETSIMQRWLLVGPLVCCAIAAFFSCCGLAADCKASRRRRHELQEMEAFVRYANVERTNKARLGHGRSLCHTIIHRSVLPHT